MDLAAFLSVMTQIALGGAAWRLANELKNTVTAHTARLDQHDDRIVRLEVVVR